MLAGRYSDRPTKGNSLIADHNPVAGEAGVPLRRRTVIIGALAVATGAASCRAEGTAQASQSLEAHGGRAQPGFDNGPALRRAGARGATINLGEGVYEFAAATLLEGDAIRLASGTRLVGRGEGRTELKVTGRSPINHLFDVRGAGDVTIKGLTVTGNAIGSDKAPDAGGFLRAILEPDAAADLTDIFVLDCTIRDFASSAWFRVVNSARDRTIRRVGSRGCTWRSRVRPPQAELIGVPAHFLYFFGAAGAITDIVIDDPLAEATFMKGAVALRGSIDRAKVSIGLLQGAGRALMGKGAGSDGAGSYAIMGYATPAGAPRNLAIRIGTLADPASVGIYLASVTDATVDIGEAYGQRDTRDDNLPKGLLALNQCRRVTATIGRAADSARVLEVSLPRLAEGETGAGLKVRLDRVESRTGAIDVTVRAPVAGRAGGLVITGARTGPAAVGVAMMIDRRTQLRGVDLSGFTGQGARQPTAILLPETPPGAVLLPHR